VHHLISLSLQEGGMPARRKAHTSNSYTSGHRTAFQHYPNRVMCYRSLRQPPLPAIRLIPIIGAFAAHFGDITTISRPFRRTFSELNMGGEAISLRR
jgi:hypothetical protein